MRLSGWSPGSPFLHPGPDPGSSWGKGVWIQPILSKNTACYFYIFYL
jgi:hypothetical protein